MFKDIKKIPHIIIIPTLTLFLSACGGSDSNNGDDDDRDPETETTSRVIDGDTFTVDTIENCGVGTTERVSNVGTNIILDTTVIFNSSVDSVDGYYNSTQIDPNTPDPTRFNMPGFTSLDDTCNDLNTHQVVLLKKYADWNGQHVNGIEVDISSDRTFGDIDRIVFEFKVNTDDSVIHTSEELKTVYGDLLTLTDEEYDFLDKGNTAFAISILNAENGDDNVQAERYVEIDQSVYGDEWVRIEVPFESMNIFTGETYERGETTHAEQADTLINRIQINPEVLGTQLDDETDQFTYGNVIRNIIGNLDNDAYLARNIPEAYKEMSINIKRLEVYYK